MVEHLGLSGLGLRDQGLVQDVKNILADLLKLGLDLLTVVADGGDVLVGTLRLLLLLNRGDDAPRGTSGSDHVLVSNGQQISLIHGKLSAQLCVSRVVSLGGPLSASITATGRGRIAYLSNLLHVCDHLIVTLGLLTEPREEGLAVVGVSLNTPKGLSRVALPGLDSYLSR